MLPPDGEHRAHRIIPWSRWYHAHRLTHVRRRRRWNEEECAVDGVVHPTAAAPAVDLGDEVLSRVLPVMPCVTTDDGCTLESGSGLAVENVPAEPAAFDGRFTDPCFWDEECAVPA